MDNKKDAFGKLLIAYFKNELSYEVFERSDGVIDPSFDVVKMYFQEYSDWLRHQKESIKFAKGNVLDVGAGAGRVSLHLQDKGFKVTAIDNSPLAIKVCKSRGIKDAKVLSFEKVGCFSDNSFDSVFMLGNNFGLFGNFKKAKKLLRILHRVTTKDAVIVTESVNPYFDKDKLNLAYKKLNLENGRMMGQIRLRIRFRECKSDWFDFLFVSKKEMVEILGGTGWKIKKFIDFDESLYIAILRKV